MAQTAVVSVFPEKSETGDTFTVKILVSGTQVMPGKVSFKLWTAVIPPENILRTGAWQRSGAQWVQQYTLIVFDSLQTELPPLSIPTHLGDSLRTNPLSIHIFPTPVPADLSDYAPLRDIRREPVLWTDYWPWAAGVLTVFALLWWRFGRRKAPVVRPAPAPLPVLPATVPAHQAALAALEALLVQQLWKQKGADTHFTQISLILRAYIEERYRFPALESTTREIMGQLESSGFPPTLKTTLQTLLQGADAVKYALSVPAEAQYRESLQKAVKIVEDTKADLSNAAAHGAPHQGH